MDNRELQDKARDLIGREVCYCVSVLIGAATQNYEAATALGFDEDDLLSLSVRTADLDDLRDQLPAGVQCRADGDSFKWKDGNGQWSPPFDSELEALRDVYDELSLNEPDGREIYEHWLVTDWFAAKLEEKGESVVRDALGLTIWGRTTTGQAIYIDGVVEAIARDLYAND